MIARLKNFEDSKYSHNRVVHEFHLVMELRQRLSAIAIRVDLRAHKSPP
jgi:hypothetical protein